MHFRKIWPLLILGACNTYTPPASYDELVLSVMQDCRNKLEAGEYQIFSDMLESCQKPRIINAFISHKDGRDKDIIEKILDHEIQVVKLVETNKITEQEGTARIEKFNEKQANIVTARQEKREAEARRLAEKARKEKEAEEKRLAAYYKKNPHEYQKFLQQQRQLELLEEQNRLLVEQQRQLAKAEEDRKFREALKDFSNSLNRQRYQPVTCNTHYGYSSSTTTCY